MGADFTNYQLYLTDSSKSEEIIAAICRRLGSFGYKKNKYHPKDPLTALHLGEIDRGISVGMNAKNWLTTYDSVFSSIDAHEPPNADDEYWKGVSERLKNPPQKAPVPLLSEFISEFARGGFTTDWDGIPELTVPDVFCTSYFVLDK